MSNTAVQVSLAKANFLVPSYFEVSAVSRNALNALHEATVWVLDVEAVENVFNRLCHTRFTLLFQ